jgi:hypothetical protein
MKHGPQNDPGPSPADELDGVVEVRAEVLIVGGRHA